MNRNGRGAAIGVTELLVRTTLPDFGETEARKDGDDLTRLEDRNTGHLNDYGVGPDELGLQLRLAILEQHGDHFAEIRVQLIERCALAMRAGETRYIPDVKIGFRAMLDDSGIGMHGSHSSATARRRSRHGGCSPPPRRYAWTRKPHQE